jgi:hypothetical protein
LFFFAFLVSDNELRRIKEAFKRSTGANGTFLNKNAFVQEILFDGTSNAIAGNYFITHHFQ